MRTSLVVYLVSLCLIASLDAQDRVILFEPSILSGAHPDSPREIREIEISEGGRRLSDVVRVGLPPHRVVGRAVALADGRKIMWLARDRGVSVLAQYDRTTYRASVVEVGRFAADAFLIADKPRARVFVIEPTRVTVVDEALRPYAFDFAGPAVIREAAAGGDRIVLRRRHPVSRAGDILIVNSVTGQLAHTVPVVPLLGNGAIDDMHFAVSSDGRRLYRAYYEDAFVVYSRHPQPPPADCRSYAPRLTMFDASTFTAVRQISLQGHCPFLVQLPAQ